MGLSGSGSQPTSTATPKMPSKMPRIFFGVSGSPIQKAATSAVNSTVVEFRMAAREAVRWTSEAEIKEKGTAVFANPTNNSGPHSPRSFSARRVVAATSTRTSAARPTRSPTSTKGPSAGTATRMNRNDAPQRAPSEIRAAKSLAVKPDVPKSRSRARAQHAPLVRQEPLLEVQPTVEPAERAVHRSHPVAGHPARPPGGGVG